MELRILFDYSALNDSLDIGWGFSVLVNETILFDTGENGDWLLNNMKQLEVNPEKINSVVISHDHWDHTGGLWKLLKSSREIEVYGCKGFSDSFKKKVKKFNSNFVQVPSIENIENCKEKLEIHNKVYSSGEILGEYDRKTISEQALVIDLENNFQNIVIITGCAHPGIVNMVEKIKNRLKSKNVSIVMGGFHLMNSNKRRIKLISDKLKKLKVEKVGPTHCSGKEAEEIFRQEYKENYIQIKVGSNLKI